MMLLFGMVLCMSDQYRVFSPLAVIIAARLHDILAARLLQGFLPIYLAGLGVAHQDSGAGCPYWWLHGPIHPKYVLWGCTLAILQAAPSRWHCPAEWNKGLPEHGDVWCYRPGSSNYSRKASLQMALSCFAICPCRAYWWGICWGA